jgi:hypothetical protein
MPDKKLKSQSPRATLAGVKKEMALPQVNKSVREASAQGYTPTMAEKAEHESKEQKNKLERQRRQSSRPANRFF